MSAIARYCRHAGLNVSGYDRTPSPVTEALEKEGIPVHFDSNVSLIPPVPEETLVIYTPAVPSDMAEMVYVREHGYRIVKRAEALGEITSGKRCLAVSGTHGKTTTSTMLAHILTESGEGCTAFLGGISKNYGTNLLLSDNDVIVAEADEFDRSFLHLHPEAAVVTSMDADHLDIYSDIDDLRRTFVKFGLQTGKSLVIKKGLEERFRSAGARAEILTYGKDGDFYASDIVSDGTGRMFFTLNTPSGAFRDFHAGVPGLVYIENATAAAAMASPPSGRTGGHHNLHPADLAGTENLRHLPASPVLEDKGLLPGVRLQPEPAGLRDTAAHISRPRGAHTRSVI